MIKELHQNSQTFVASKLFIEIAIRFFSLSEIPKSFGRFFHDENIRLAAGLSERI